MAKRFVTIDRDTPMLLPPVLQDWLPWDHPARLAVQLVEGVDMSAAAINTSGSGSEQYPPSMMLALLLHCYAHGVFSSRAIERATFDDIGVRYITGDTHPDHDTICKFRRENRELIKVAFRDGLRLAAEAGILQLGCVAMDGSKVQGQVSSREKLTIAQLEEQIRLLAEEEAAAEGVIGELLERAEELDRREEQESPAAAAGISDARALAEKLAEARKQLRKKESRRARLEAARAQFAQLKEDKSRAREQMREEIRGSGIGRVPDRLDPEVRPCDRICPNDPDTSRMKGGGGVWVDGYSAQALVDCEGSGLLLGARTCQESSDRHQLEANVSELAGNLEAIGAGAGEVEVVLADKGFDNTYQIAKIESGGGPQMLCQQQRNGKAGGAKSQCRDRAARTGEVRERHRERLGEPGNREKMRRRRETIEPSFGIIKEQMGFRRFNLCGREKVDTEWRLVAGAFNLRKLNVNAKWRRQLLRKAG